MAVKEFPSEPAKQRAESRNYNVTNILALIDQISQNIDVEPDLPSVCAKIVNLLGHVEINVQSDQIKLFRERIKKVDQFFEHASNRINRVEIVTACLQELYTIIMTIERPSPAAGIVLHLVDEQHIPDATKKFLQTYTSEEDIRRGVNTLMSWIPSSHFIGNLREWISCILYGLCELKRYALLMAIADTNIDMLLKWSAVPMYNDCTWPIILYMLRSVQHTPIIFNKVLKLYTVTNSKQMPRDEQLANQLKDTMAALLLRFPDQIGTEIARHKLQPSENFRDSLSVAPWHDQRKVVARRSPIVGVGLINLGNTCYMNSVLQALKLSKQFTRDLLTTDVRTPLFQNMQRLYAQLLHSKRPELMPNDVLRTARPAGFHPGHEQDSSEFLGHLLDQLHEHELAKLMQHSAAAAAIDSASASIAEQLAASAGGAGVAAAADANANANALPVQIDAAAVAAAVASATASSSSSAAAAANASQQQQLGATGQRRHPPTVIERSFGGVISITYKCLECQQESKQFDAFRDLHLSFPDPESNAAHSVQELLDFYCTAERLDADNKYFCERCGKLCIGQRYIDIVDAPRSLILTLKHFKYDQKYNMRAKLMHKVRHEEVIAVRLCQPHSDHYAETAATATEAAAAAAAAAAVTLYYRLYAAVVHSGTSMETGHYFTYGTDANGLCFLFDDSHVSRANSKDVHNLQPPQTPYILFYQRIDAEPQVATAAAASPASAASASVAVKAPLSPCGASTSPASSTGVGSEADHAPQPGGPRSPNSRSEAELALAELCEYPALEDLAPQLREHVNRDNIAYNEESRRRRHEEDEADESGGGGGGGSSVLARNRRNDTYKRDDDDEDGGGGPPSSCGAGFAPTHNNRYIS